VALLSLLSGTLPLAIAGYFMYRALGPQVRGSVSGIRLGSPTRALWDRVGGPPVPVRIGGKEAVLGRMRLSEDQLYVVATDAETLRPLWKLGPLGTYSEGYRVTFFVVAGQRVVVSDARGTVHIHDLASGQLLKQVPLTDRAANLCLTAPSAVAVAVVDGHHLTIDTDSLTLTEAALPAGCDAQHRSFRSRDGGGHVRKPTLRGFSVQDAHLEGELGVAAAVKSPGTPTPYALGFAQKTREILWQQLLPTVEPLSVRATEYDALVASRYLAIYGVGSAGWHLTALDAKDGARLWDVELRPLFAVDSIEALVVTPQYAYVNRTSSLDIYDAATGKLRGSVGNDTYR
jgi:outer membrane protein assembly factor BamB